MVRSCLPVVSVTTSPGDGEASTYSRPSAPCRTARRPGPMGVRIRCLAKRSTSSGSCASAAAQPETSKPIAMRTFSWEAILVRMPPVDYYGRPGGCRTCLGAGAPARRRRGGAGLRTTSVGSCRRPPQAHHRALRGRASLPRRFALSAALPLGTARLGQGRMGASGWPPPALLPAHPDRRQNPRRAALALARFLGSRESAPARALPGEDFDAGRGEPVAAPAAASRRLPFALDPAAPFQAVEQRIKRSDVEAKHALGALGDELAEAVDNSPRSLCAILLRPVSVLPARPHRGKFDNRPGVRSNLQEACEPGWLPN